MYLSTLRDLIVLHENANSIVAKIYYNNVNKEPREMKYNRKDIRRFIKTAESSSNILSIDVKIGNKFVTLWSKSSGLNPEYSNLLD